MSDLNTHVVLLVEGPDPNELMDEWALSDPVEEDAFIIPVETTGRAAHVEGKAL